MVTTITFTVIVAGIVLAFFSLAATVSRDVSRFCANESLVAGALGDILRVAERTEAKVERLDQRQRALLDASDHGVFFCDSDGRNTFVSAPYAAMLGTETANLMAHGWRDFIAGGSAGLAAYDEAWQGAFQTGAHAKLSVGMLRNTESGPVEFLAVVLVAAITVNGKIEHYLGIVRRA